MLDYLVRYFSLTYTAVALIVGYTIFFWGRRYKNYREVQALGGFSPSVKTYLPFSFDFIYHGVTSALENRNLALWEWFYESTGTDANGTGSYTVEVVLAGVHRVIFTADPENTKAILTTQFSDYGKGSNFHDEWEEFLGDSIFTTDHDQWHASRQLIRPMFIRERVGDLPLFEKPVQKLIKLLGPGNGMEVDVSKLFFRYTLDAVTDFLLGKSVDSLDDQVEFADAFNEVQRVQSIISRAGPLNSFVPRKSFRQGLRVLEDFIEPYITQALSMSPDELEQKLSKSDTFIHALARFTRSRKVIRDQLTAILLAGRDTTAATLSWTFLELARHPKVTQKLRKEILDTVGESKPPTYSDLKDMKYLTYVINETLRLYPSVPFNVRTALVPTTLPRGGGPDGMQPIGVREGTSIGYSPLLMHRRRDLYPPISESFPYDPLEWAPDRWATWTPKSWNYIPFNGGPRICIGQQFAVVEMGYTICRILQAMGSVEDRGSRCILKSEIVLTPAEGVNVAFWKPGAKKEMA